MDYLLGKLLFEKSHLLDRYLACSMYKASVLHKAQQRLQLCVRLCPALQELVHGQEGDSRTSKPEVIPNLLSARHHSQPLNKIESKVISPLQCFEPLPLFASPFLPFNSSGFLQLLLDPSHQLAARVISAQV